MNPDKCYLTGDSAGSLLSLFTLSIEGGAMLQKKFGIQPSDVHFRACGRICS